MKLRLAKNRRSEWPIVKLWYTKKKGQTIEGLIESDTAFFEWMVSNFQNVTPKQARFYTQVSGRHLPEDVIQDVEPYEWRVGDPESLYGEICTTQNLKESLAKYRGRTQLAMF